MWYFYRGMKARNFLVCYLASVTQQTNSLSKTEGREVRLIYRITLGASSETRTAISPTFSTGSYSSLALFSLLVVPLSSITPNIHSMQMTSKFVFPTGIILQRSTLQLLADSLPLADLVSLKSDISKSDNIISNTKSTFSTSQDTSSIFRSSRKKMSEVAKMALKTLDLTSELLLSFH